MAGRNREVRKGPWLTSAEASSRLGVHRATLYAYVSRSLIRSSRSPDDPRARRYSSEDVESMRRRGEQRRDPGKAAERALRRQRANRRRRMRRELEDAHLRENGRCRRLEVC